MRRLLPLVLVALGALVAGVAITGLPSKVPSDVVSQGLTPIPSAPAGATEPVATPPPSPPASPESLVPATPAMTDPPTTAASSIPLSAPPSVPATPPPTAPTTTIADPSQLIVVVANAGPADRLAARMAAAINALGYAQTVVTTARARRPVSEVYFAPGRDQEGLALASGIGLAPTQVHPFPGTAVSVADASADLWLIVGTDLLQRFEGGG